MKAPSEHVEQRRFVEWVRLTHKVRVFAIPNGGKRGRLEAMRLVAEGVSAGVPDLYIPAWGLWVEMKTTTGRISPVQRDWHAYLTDIGDTVIVGMGFDDACAKVAAFMETP